MHVLIYARFQDQALQVCLIQYAWFEERGLGGQHCQHRPTTTRQLHSQRDRYVGALQLQHCLRFSDFELYFFTSVHVDSLLVSRVPLALPDTQNQGIYLPPSTPLTYPHRQPLTSQRQDLRTGRPRVRDGGGRSQHRGRPGAGLHRGRHVHQAQAHGRRCRLIRALLRLQGRLG